MAEQDQYPLLFRYFADLQGEIPWKQLGEFPTPVRKLDSLGPKNLWIKQDNLSSSIYGGNKIRKLEFVLADVLKQKKKSVVTLGAIGTNHGLATAIFAEKLGIGCTLLLFKQPVNRDVKEKLLLFAKYNARMMYCTTKLRAALAFYVTMRIKHPAAYFLYAGGSSPTGTVGFVNAAFELKSQIESGVVPEPAVIFCPAGSNGTLAGLTLGVMLAGLKSKTVGVRVSASHLGPIQICTPDAVLRLMKSTYRYLRKNGQTIPELELKAPLILNDYFGEGYGRPTKAGNEASALAKKADVVLDSTYTAKTFAAVLDYCQVHSSESEPVLYWHTYNSVDMAAKINWSDADKLPPPFQKFVSKTKRISRCAMTHP
ncbi:MAG: pyridoxal-phosphate dependent enzyme [Desulfobacterales bacterium]|jgi:D-cysteine desulfhydrase